MMHIKMIMKNLGVHGIKKKKLIFHLSIFKYILDKAHRFPLGEWKQSTKRIRKILATA